MNLALLLMYLCLTELSNFAVRYLVFLDMIHGEGPIVVNFRLSIAHIHVRADFITEVKMIKSGNGIKDVSLFAT